MARVDALRLAVHEAELERLVLVQAGKPETHNHTTVDKTSLMVNMRSVSCCFRGTGDFEDAAVEIGLLDLRHAVGRGAFPTVADGLHAIAVLLALERVVKNQRAFLTKPRSVIARTGG